MVLPSWFSGDELGLTAYNCYTRAMANTEHVDLLKRSVTEWNRYRRREVSGGVHWTKYPDFQDADLSDMDLASVILGDFEQGGDLHVVNLKGANLSKSNLYNAFLRDAVLGNARLVNTNLHSAHLRGAALWDADLTGAVLEDANLCNANLVDANLDGAIFGGTILSGVHMFGAKNLDRCKHSGPSFIDAQTLNFSPNIPMSFLKGCGLQDWEILSAKLHNPSLRRDQRTDILYEIDGIMNDQPIKYESLFISYAREDDEFATKLHDSLQEKGVRCWFAPHDIKSGRKVHEQLDRAIHLQDRLLLLLSESSIASEWVKIEISRALKREKEEGVRVLFPIRLCTFKQLEAWRFIDPETGKDMAAEIREYFIPGFSEWQKPDAYEAAFDRLLEDLKPLTPADPPEPHARTP